MDIYTLKLNENGLLSIFDDMGSEVDAAYIIHKAGSNVFALDAPMGAGKTTLIRTICSQLGVTDIVNSPTFAIVNIYEVSNSSVSDEIYHFDCYRLKSISEAQDMGAEEYLYSGKLCFIEWPDIIKQLLPDDTVWMKILVSSQGHRILQVYK